MFRLPFCWLFGTGERTYHIVHHRRAPVNSALCYRETNLKKIMKAMISVLIASLACTTYAADPKEIEKKVDALNAQSLKSLGVSLNALRYLVSANANHYLLLSHLEQSDDIKFIRELESKRYVRTQTMRGLPDGTQRNGTFIRVVPVGDRIELQRCMIALQHNTNLQPTR